MHQIPTKSRRVRGQAGESITPSLSVFWAVRKTPRRKARAYLKTWITQALRSRITPMANLALRLRRHFNQIAAAVELGLSNSRAEGINSIIRVIQRRGYGHPGPDGLTAMIHLCLVGIRINLPTQT
jgi:transposase